MITPRSRKGLRNFGKGIQMGQLERRSLRPQTLDSLLLLNYLKTQRTKSHSPRATLKKLLAIAVLIVILPWKIVKQVLVALLLSLQTLAQRSILPRVRKWLR